MSKTCNEEDRERSSVVLSGWKDEKMEIERMTATLVDRVHAQLYSTGLEIKRIKAESKRIKSITFEEKPLNEERKQLNAKSKCFKQEYNSLTSISEELQSLRVSWKKASNRILNSIDKANTIGRREELSKKLNNLAKDTKTKIVDLSEKVVKRVKESDPSDG